MESILVVNAGSSSLKFQLFGIEPARQLKRLLKGQVDGIGVRPRLRAAMIDSSTAVDRVFPPDEIPDLPAAIHVTGAWLRETQQVDLVAIGHRVVHGGPEYSQPVLVSEEVIDRLARYTTLAPRLAKENNRHRQSEAELARQDIGRQPQWSGRAMRFFNSGLREARCVSLLPILKQVGSGCHATASSGERGGPRKSRDCFDAGVERGCRLRRRRLRLRYRALGGSVVMTRSDPRAAYPSQEPGKIFYGTIGKNRDLGGDNSPVISPCVAKCTNR